MPPTSPNILAVRFSSIGDILLTTPLLRAIRRTHPGARLTVLTKREFVPLLSHNPHLSRVIGLAPGGSLFTLAAELRGDGYTHRLDLHDNLRSRALRTLVPGRWHGYPKHRWARALLIHGKRNRYRDRRPVPERYFSAVEDLGVTPDGAPPEFFIGAEATEQVEEWLGSVGLHSEPNILALAPGAAHATKRWPLEHWRRLVGKAVKDGLAVVIVGGPDDAALAVELAEGAGNRVAKAAGAFGLQATGALLRRARVLVSGDTGVMHMATGVGTPVVALFGPTVEAFGFFPYTREATVLELPLPCRPCTSQGGPRCPLGHHRCLVDIEPAVVHEALGRRLR
ncbi:MAG: glycosyltransferase family 9 protein [Gemmatimonadales bacterium]